MHHKMVDPWSRNAFMAYEPKVIGVDFDETISDNPEGWLQILLLMERIGYHVVIVTWRKPTEWPTDLDFLVDKGFKIYYTSRQSKQKFMNAQGIKVSIWIDDNPSAILFNQGESP
jgi:hypothetical protein